MTGGPAREPGPPGHTPKHDVRKFPLLSGPADWGSLQLAPQKQHDPCFQRNGVFHEKASQPTIKVNIYSPKAMVKYNY